MQGTASPKRLCRSARQKGYTTLALTDINNFYGLWPFLNACKEEELVPIIGAEVRTGAHRLFCLVKDQDGYRNLCRLLTSLHCDQNFDLMTSLETQHQGLALLATSQDMLSCCQGIGADTVAALTGRPNQHNSNLRRTAHTLGVPAVAVQDSLYLSPEDYSAHRLLRAIDRNCSLCRLPENETTAEAWLPGITEWRQRFHLWPECLSAAISIAERCTLRTPYTGLIMPPWP